MRFLIAAITAGISLSLSAHAVENFSLSIDNFRQLEKEALAPAYSLHQTLKNGDKISGTQVFLMRKKLQAFADAATWLQDQDSGLDLAFQVQKLESAYHLHDAYLNLSPALRTFFRDQWTDPGAGLTPFREFMRLNLYPRHAQLLEKKLLDYMRMEHAPSSVDDAIVSSLPYKLVDQGYSLQDLTPSHVPVVAGFRDVGIDLWTDFSNSVSGNYGNVAGRVKWRTGWLMNNPKALLAFASSLKPLDVVVNKTGNKLTDLNIPGNFGHAAIYLGTETQLRELGLWDRPELQPLQEKIKSGFLIMEMTRHGIGYASLEETLEADEVAVLRVGSITRGEHDLSALYTQALAQRGKSYDFNFDANTTTRITCTEFVAQVLDFLPWGSDVILGRHAITPDHVGQMVQYPAAEVDLMLYLRGESQGRLNFLDKLKFLQAVAP